MSDTGRPLPKFGEWDVNDPSSADSFTVIFNKARDERKTSSNNQGSNPPANELSDQQKTTHATSKSPSSSRKWFCCLKSSPAES
ncbi:RPM1-interacting protein 4-like isoform X2 [Phalaenopsis equestris]|uniref:RPM1-interacting protein 4-like isoform X2 n=1 Tax=Phalaenopsis equestris TaxID=78828 RepID=UPI0009E55A51|nr:RPM1-interacting protein 4-like isoform X2 [Phalaenopsis equestris]